MCSGRYPKGTGRPEGSARSTDALRSDRYEYAKHRTTFIRSSRREYLAFPLPSYSQKVYALHNGSHGGALMKEMLASEVLPATQKNAGRRKKHS